MADETAPVVNEAAGEATARQAPAADVDPRLSRVVVVLYEPQDDINIGNTVRVCKNFGITDLRLVRPAHADPERIRISAPKADDVIGALAHYDDLDEALADCVYVVASTARARKASWIVTEPRGAAVKLVEAAGSGRVAIVFGREDHGLPNEAVDRADLVVTIPTNPGYTSLNLGQAVLLLVWEVFRIAQGVPVEAVATARPDSEHEPAEHGQVERMIAQVEQALHAIAFFKYGTTEHVMRGVRGVFQRAQLDSRELAIFFGVFKEIEASIERVRASLKDPKA